MLVPRSRTRGGSATLTMGLSIRMTRRLTHSTTRVSQRRRWICSSAASASELLSKEGASGLSVRRIAAAAGCSTMGLYSRFGGKDGVVDELYAEGFVRLIGAMKANPVTGDAL